MDKFFDSTLVKALVNPLLVQVDCHYLQLYLWRFVADEAVVQQLLEEVCEDTQLSSFTR